MKYPLLRTRKRRVVGHARDRLADASQYDGFAGCIALYSAENGRAKGILLWESKEAAEVAEETLVERRPGMASSAGLTVESGDLYEVPVFEV